MLQTLYIENIAVIEKTSIEFNRGLNVLTGETGAGKSIIIDAINAVMGHRTSKDIIRTGEQSAFVSAQFENINGEVSKKLEELGFCDDEGTLVLQRTLNASGKSVCKINGKPATVSMLKELSVYLINIHGQHESYELFSPDTHIDYIDRYGKCDKLLAEYQEKYREYKILKKKLDEANTDDRERLHEIDLLTFQVNELSQADVKAGEEEQLRAERTALLSVEKIFSLLNDAKIYLSGNDNFTGGIDAVDSACSDVQKASEYNAEYSAVSDALSDAYYNLRDCAENISDAIDNLESDPQRLEEIEERLDLLSTLSRKYGCPSDELGDLLQKLETRLDELVNFDKNRDELINAVQKSESVLMKAAVALSEKRKKSAAEFSKRVKEEMSFLNMPNVELVAEFEQIDFTSKGIDKAELLISANPGETPRPVAKIASGGELSRMMLAIKTVLSQSDTVDTLIFDEVDTGISGSAAQKVGFKLKQVSENCQVLCVTHQAQIAALADYHYLISKQIDGGRTFTDVSVLDYEGRKNELARIIGGVNITDAALSHAEAMLRENRD